MEVLEPVKKILALMVCCSAAGSASSQELYYLGLPYQPPSLDDFDQERVSLGRKLFSDRSLSSDGSTACVTCHNPDYAFSDNRSVSVGVSGRVGTLNSPSLLNSRFWSRLGWQSDMISIEASIEAALVNPIEMDISPGEIEIRAGQGRIDLLDFEAEDPSSSAFDEVVALLATYVRSLNAASSRVDLFLFQEEPQLSRDEIAGMELFFGKAHCSVCHTVRHSISHPFGGNHALFSDQRLHDIGVEPNGGRRFRTPTLRNVSLTAPYMHNGSFGTLAEVVKFYNRGGGCSESKDPILRPLNLLDEEIDQIVSFLFALTSFGVGGANIVSHEGVGEANITVEKGGEQNGEC